jgi:chitin disaccharide deacetylase
MSQTHRRITNQLLGYPDDARLLLINADDFGMYQAINEGIVRAFREGVVRSTSLMMPCPDASQAVQLLKENPAIRFGVHLSIIRDIDDYFWLPLAPKNDVPSLLDTDGNFYTLGRMTEMLARAKLDELEVEFRAQIEAVLATELKPTHLDWHCLHSGGRADIFDMTLGLAKEYGFALRVASHPFIEQVQGRGLPTDDYELLDSFALSIDEKSAQYADLLRELPAGLTEWAVHPSLGSADSQAIDPDGWRVRRTDFDFLISPQAREIMQQEGIELISYEPMQRVWQERLA